MTTHSGGQRSVLVTGGTGYLGTRLIARLLDRGHAVRALVRAPSARKLPAGCEAVIGDVLRTTDVAEALHPGETIVHLVGTSHPSPAKAPLFRSVDLASARATVDAAIAGQAVHVVYVSVAHPAPVMAAYIAARVEAEALLGASGIPVTILRPWYVLGPGHQWPHLLRPMYALAGLVGPWREGARRLGLVTIADMVGALVWATERPVKREVRIVEVPEIREIGRTA